jgi:hypothetical protein
MISELENKKNYLLERSKSIKNYKISILKKQKEIFDIYQKKYEEIYNKVNNSFDFSNSNSNIPFSFNFNIKTNEKLNLILKNLFIDSKYNLPLIDEKISINLNNKFLISRINDFGYINEIEKEKNDEIKYLNILKEDENNLILKQKQENENLNKKIEILEKQFLIKNINNNIDDENKNLKIENNINLNIFEIFLKYFSIDELKIIEFKKFIELNPKIKQIFEKLNFIEKPIKTEEIILKEKFESKILNGEINFEDSKIYEFFDLTLSSGCKLFSSKHLILKIYGTLTIDQNSSIDMTGKGFKGGIQVNNEGDGISYQGESYQGNSTKNKNNNFGGGGAGHGSSSYGSTGGGGGGYGSKGNDSQPNIYGGGNHDGGKGGDIYGDDKLSILYCGSGGGSGHPYSTGIGGKGGNGGGIIEIFCSNIK